jgi:hypothetical protein
MIILKEKVMTRKRGPRPFLVEPKQISFLISNQLFEEADNLAIELNITRGELFRRAYLYYKSSLKRNVSVKERSEF